jgi:hypothetical protein
MSNNRNMTDTKLMDYLIKPTDSSAVNYGIHGGLGALVGGGLGALFSGSKNRLRNSLLFALLGGGLGAGAGYLANNNFKLPSFTNSASPKK